MAGTTLYVVDVCAHDKPFDRPGRRHSPDTMNLEMVGGDLTPVKEFHRIRFQAHQNPEELISRVVKSQNLEGVPWNYEQIKNPRVFQREVHAYSEVYFYNHGANTTYLKTVKKGFAFTRMLGHHPDAPEQELVVVVYRWASGKGALQYDKALLNMKMAAKGFRAFAILLQREGKPLKGMGHSAGGRCTSKGLSTWTLDATELPHVIVLVACNQPQTELLECAQRAQFNDNVKLDITMLVSQEDAALMKSETYHSLTWYPGGPAVMQFADGPGPRVGLSRDSVPHLDLGKPTLTFATIDCTRAQCAHDDRAKHGYPWSSAVSGAVLRAKLRGHPMPPTMLVEERTVVRNGTGPALPTACPFVWEASWP